MKKLLFTVLASLAISASANAVVADRLWIIGEPAGGWDTTLGIELNKTADGVFEYDADFDSKKSFGFVDRLAEANDWDSFNAHRYVAPNWGTVPVVGENPMEYATSDFCWDLPEGKYHMTIDTNKMQLIIYTDEEGGDIPEVKIPDLYFVGESIAGSSKTSIVSQPTKTEKYSHLRLLLFEALPTVLSKLLPMAGFPSTLPM